MTNATFTLRRAVAADAPVLWAIHRDAILRTCRSHYPDALLQHWASGPVPASFPRNIENGYFVAGRCGFPRWSRWRRGREACAARRTGWRFWTTSARAAPGWC